MTTQVRGRAAREAKLEALVESLKEAQSELAAAEQFILTVTETGFGKRSSAHEYRRTGRGGQGLTAHGLGGRAGPEVGRHHHVAREARDAGEERPGAHGEEAADQADRLGHGVPRSAAPV